MQSYVTICAGDVMPSTLKHVTALLDAISKKKIQQVAAFYGLTASAYMAILARKAIRDFEAENGIIETSMIPDRLPPVRPHKNHRSAKQNLPIDV
jgi:hypothetical protein